MKIDIEKISNGYVANIDGVKTFCDVPEAICGLTSEKILATCKNLDEAKKAGSFDDAMFQAAMSQASDDIQKQAIAQALGVRRSGVIPPPKPMYVGIEGKPPELMLEDVYKALGRN